MVLALTSAGLGPELLHAQQGEERVTVLEAKGFDNQTGAYKIVVENSSGSVFMVLLRDSIKGLTDSIGKIAVVTLADKEWAKLTVPGRGSAGIRKVEWVDHDHLKVRIVHFYGFDAGVDGYKIRVTDPSSSADYFVWVQQRPPGIESAAEKDAQVSIYSERRWKVLSFNGSDVRIIRAGPVGSFSVAP